MKESYSDNLKLSKSNILKLEIINNIIDEYNEQGFKLTLRQLYYQLVSRDIIPNKQSEYAKISSILVKGRMAGQVDWDAIEDRIRVPRLPYYYHNVKDALLDTALSYRLDRQKGQKNYIEVWVEKDALSGILIKITGKFHVRLMVNRGYSSCTAMHDAAIRIQNALDNDYENAIIFYLGDHDPSGIDMVRDIQDRLDGFHVDAIVKKIALTMNQVKKFNPPPNPAKITDPRAKWYISQYGNTSWEVDAISPKDLLTLLTKTIKNNIDINLFNDILEKELEDKVKLRSHLKR